MAENRKDGNGLYYFSKAQLITVATGFTLTSVLVFLLGILIGRGIEERKLLKQEEPLVKVPLQPLAPGSKSQAKDELTFYDTLGKTPAGSPPARVQPAPAKEIKSAEKAAKAEVKQEVKTAKASAPEEPAAAQKAKAGAEKGATETKKAAPAQKPAEEEKPKTDAAPQERVWTVQVNAFPDEARAQKLVERLKGKGYDAFMVVATIRGKDWYRVRVGHFAARAQAKELQQTLQTKENFTNAISVSR